jgi:hypothetical protein
MGGMTNQNMMMKSETIPLLSVALTSFITYPPLLTLSTVRQTTMIG